MAVMEKDNGEHFSAQSFQIVLLLVVGVVVEEAAKEMYEYQNSGVTPVIKTA